MTDAPRTLAPASAAAVLVDKLQDPTRPMTVADAAVASGLALRDAEAGLHHLTHEYRGHLRVTEDGDLVHVFPHGFTKPWETREALARALDRAGRAALGAGRFLVRAWLLIAMVGYALIFAAVMIGLAFARGGSDRDSDVGVGVRGALFRAIADALFWTLHPWSPLYVGELGESAPAARTRGRRREEEVPFYEKVNRFVFGPPEPPPDPHASRARLLEEIRRKKGRIGLSDVMRATGLPRDEADPLMARLMLDHDGTVEVGEQGGIVYGFPALRRTASVGQEAGDGLGGRPGKRRRRGAIWEEPRLLPPLTGNTVGANLAVAALNAFNLMASSVVMAKGLTVANVMLLLFTKPKRGEPPLVLPDDGMPIVLGLVPFVFSVALFLLPMARAALRRSAARKLAKENARLAILREVLDRAPRKEPVPDEVLRAAHRAATGEDPSSKEITARVVDLGGDVDVGPDGEVRYRFADLEAEAEAVEEERERAGDDERRIGKVVFTSEA